MRGLLLKDLMLIRNEKRALIVLLAGGAFMSLSFEATAVISYLVMVAALVAVGTISYDEFDNGFSFLFTLPVSRRTYVREKYLFSLIWTVFCLLLGILAGTVLIYFARRTEFPAYKEQMVPEMAVITAVAMLFMAVMIPVRIKYGSEKGKTVQFIIYGVIILAVAGIVKMDTILGTGMKERILRIIRGWEESTALLSIILAAVVLLIVSERITERVITNKEY